MNVIILSQIYDSDINSSNFYFSVNEDDVVVYGLGAIKGLGEGPAETILSARKINPLQIYLIFARE